MCGICGIYDVTSPDNLLSEAKKMNASALHRGPDDSGLLMLDNCNSILCQPGHIDSHNETGTPVLVLAHRRLSIIDLSSAGRQPMSDESGRFWIVYNGEVYNYPKIRSRLQSMGYYFVSGTDTEVVLKAYMEWGPDCLKMFNGMWSLAIFDRREGTLFCSRDRFGIKPFYYTQSSGKFAFASEIKQLMSLSWVTKTPDYNTLADFFLWGLENHTCNTFFNSIKALPPSHYVIIDRNALQNGQIRPVRYWDINPSVALNETDAVHTFSDLFTDAVRLRLRSDVPVGVTLSGGLDSSSVVCIAGQLTGHGSDIRLLKAFNVEFDGDGYSEKHYAELAAQKANAVTTVLKPKHTDLARDWQNFIFHIEQPVSSLSFFSNFQIYKLIRSHGIPVVLTGQGGDELLLGYERYRSYDALFNLKKLRIIRCANKLLKAKMYAGLQFSRQLAYALYFLNPGLRVRRRLKMTASCLNTGFFSEYADKTDAVKNSSSYQDYLSMWKGELFHFQLPHLLHHEDSMSMAHSIETRLPFLDYRLVDFVVGQSPDVLFHDGWSKYLLRQAMKDILPEQIRTRKDKMGYETPTRFLLMQNREMMISMFDRNQNDTILNMSELKNRFLSGNINERFLCSAATYLSWKEVFNIN